MIQELLQNAHEPFLSMTSLELGERVRMHDAHEDALEDRLWRLQTQAPSCLPVYGLLYRLHLQRSELATAERAALAGLAQAGLQCGLPTEITYGKIAASAADFSADNAARFWLFTLHTLATVYTRSGEPAKARLLREWIARCDPHHSLGTDALFWLSASNAAR